LRLFSFGGCGLALAALALAALALAALALVVFCAYDSYPKRTDVIAEERHMISNLSLMNP